MSKLDELIKELCPNGVKYKQLGKVLDYKQPYKYIVQSTKYDDEFKTPVLTAGQTFILGYTDEEDGIYQASKENPVIIFDDFTTANKWVDFRFKVKSSAMKLLTSKDNDKYNLRYLFHVLQTIKYIPVDHSRQWIEKYSKFEIPVPPLEVQSEIVRILDNFTLLTAELTAELTARKKQYEYYRDKLLTFSDDVEWKTLNNIATFTYGYTDKALNKGNVRFLRITDINAEGCLNVDNPKYLNLNEENKKYLVRKGDLLMARTGATYGKTLYVTSDEPSIYASFLIKINLSDDVINNRYYWHFSKSNLYWSQANKLVTSGGQPQFNANALKQVFVPLPPLEEQQRIVDILDRFDKLCNDISEGLPAEIEARKKQYEYYRDKLLTFKQLQTKAENAV